MIFHRSSKRARRLKAKISSTSLKGVNRRACFEPLELRNLMSVTLPTLANQTVLAGAPLNIALASAGTNNPVSYTVSVDNGKVTAAVPTGNTFLKLHVQDLADGIDGDMVFELFNDLAPKTVANLTSLINRTPNFYNGLTFHRIIKNFMIQGGDPAGTGSGGPNYQFDDEYNANLQFTSSGILAMANSGNDTNGSQFFITAAPYRYGDFNYSIFGFLVEGDNIRNAINNVATGTNDRPNHTVTITSASIITNNQDGVLRLSAPIGTTGSSVITVTAKDTVTNETSVQHFTATVAADTNNDPPFLGTINPIQTTVNTPVTFNIPATDVEGDAIYYKGTVVTGGSKLGLSVNSATGAVTITPAADLAPGVYSVKIEVGTSSTNLLDAQTVPIYINPAAPTGIQLLAASDTGSSTSDGVTNLNNTSGKTLQFQVNGVISGADVELFADGVSLGHAVATGTSVVIATNGTATLTDGAHAITAKQTLKNQAVNVGNLSTTTDLASAASSSLSVIVDTTAPQYFFTPITTASIGIAYNCQAAVVGDLAGTIAYELTQAPTGMTVNASTGLINWTPPAGQTSPVPVTLKATDRAGNSNLNSFSIAIVLPNNAPVLVSKLPAIGTITEDSLISANLGMLINSGTNTTAITDSDSGAAVGGIALTSLNGHGTWAYKLDQTNFITITNVSDASALLLPKDATLRYTSDNKNGETATITYRAWDTTTGISGGRINLSQAVLYGGNTAFSSATDTASVTVTALNDAPVLTGANPLLGTTDIHVAKIININGVFINNGTGTTNITDADTNALVGGIALSGVHGAGAWEYSLDGTTYTAVGTVSETAALLLPKEVKLRYTPNGTSAETASISYHAWDATSGAAGDKVDLSAAGAAGGTTAFSLLTDTASLSVLDVNDAPVLTPANPSLGTTTEDAPKTINVSGVFINNGTGTTIIADSDANASATLGGIAIVGFTGAGKWEYSLDGTTFVTISSVSASSALLLPKTAALRYTPEGKNAESVSIAYRAWDTTTGSAGARANLSQTGALGGTTAFSTASDTATLAVTAVNDAPVVVAAHPSLGTIAPGAVKTFSLADFINSQTGSTTITDVDTSAVLGGIALIGVSGGGTWEYAADGSTFKAVGTVSATSALLLNKNSKFRYTAGASTTDTPSITYRAWDTTSGTDDTKVDLSATGATGGIAAYSALTDTATLTIAGGSLSGFVYLDCNNDGQADSIPYGLPGIPVKLLSKNTSGVWTEVAGKSPVLTAADGSYHFENLVAGTYRIQETQPTNFLDGKDTAGKINGASKGTVGSDSLDIQLTGGEHGVEYNFGERGLKLEKLTLRMFLATAPTGAQAITQFNTAPVVDLAKSLPGQGYTTLLPTSGVATAITATDATITDADSPMLARMTVTLANPLDGNSESLSATIANTSIASNYANGVLTLSGAADWATYAQVLKTIKYSDAATTPQTADRQIRIVVNDGVADSEPVIATLTATQESAQAAVDSIFHQENDWLVN
jgi:cyclophilin family peptidyl-prolyl cis-trans isomerase